MQFYNNFNYPMFKGSLYQNYIKKPQTPNNFIQSGSVGTNLKKQWRREGSLGKKYWQTTTPPESNGCLCWRVKEWKNVIVSRRDRRK